MNANLTWPGPMTDAGNSRSQFTVQGKPVVDPKIRRRAFISGVAALALIVVVASLVFTSIQSLVDTRRTVDHTRAVIEELNSLLIDLENLESRVRGYVITGNKDFLGNHAETVHNIAESIGNLRRLASNNPAQSRTLDTLGTKVNEKIRFMDGTTYVLESRGRSAAAARILSGEGKTLMDSVREAVQTIRGRELKLLSARTQREKQSLHRAAVVGGVGVLAAMLLAIAAVVLFRRVLLALAEGRRSSLYAETLLNATREGIYGLEKNGTITFVNRAMSRVLGYQPDEMIGKAAHALFHHTRSDGTAYPAADCPMYQILKGAPDGSIDNEIIWRRDGTSIPVEYSANKMMDSGGNIGLVVSFRDITDRQTAEAALREGKEAAESANRAKSDFLARMSHELRTPLNSVIGFSNVLLRNKAGNLRDQEIGYLERIHKNGINLLSLINDILDLSKIEAGKMEVDLGQVSLPDLINDVASQFEPQLQEKGIGLRLIVPEEVSDVESDSGKLRQILTNLVSNAIKFTEGGDVRILLETDPATHAPRKLSVIDSGIGISPDRIDAIFEAFEQAEKSTTRKYGGTGLGLPICRSLCALLGYELSVQSKEGEGSTFSINFEPQPRLTSGVTEVLPSPEAELAGSDAILAGKLVLIVDDDADARTLIAHQVASLGGRSAGAATGEDALRLAREISPDLITLDLLMPGMNGMEILDTVKNDAQLRDIGVVIVSSAAQEHGTGLVGALSVLPKPLDLQALSRALKKGLGVGRVLVVEDDADSQFLLASYLYESGAAEVRVVAGAKDALAALADFSPDLVLLDMIVPQGGGETFLKALTSQEYPGPLPQIIVVTGKELSSQEARNLQVATLSIVTKGSDLEQNLKRELRAFALRRSRTPERPLQRVNA